MIDHQSVCVGRGEGGGIQGWLGGEGGVAGFHQNPSVFGTSAGLKAANSSAGTLTDSRASKHLESSVNQLAAELYWCHLAYTHTRTHTLGFHCSFLAY